MPHPVRRRVHQVRTEQFEVVWSARMMREVLEFIEREARVADRPVRPWHSRGLRDAPAQTSLTAHAFLNTTRGEHSQGARQGCRRQNAVCEESAHDHLATKTVCKMSKGRDPREAQRNEDAVAVQLMVPNVKECDGDDSRDHVQNTARGIANVSAPGGLKQSDPRDVLAMCETQCRLALVVPRAIKTKQHTQSALGKELVRAAERRRHQGREHWLSLASLIAQISSSDLSLAACEAPTSRKGDTGFPASLRLSSGTTSTRSNVRSQFFRRRTLRKSRVQYHCRRRSTRASWTVTQRLSMQSPMQQRSQVPTNRESSSDLPCQ